MVSPHDSVLDATGSKSLRGVDLASRVAWWTTFLRHDANIPMAMTVDVLSDTTRHEIRLSASGRLIMIGLVRTDDDDEAVEVAAQAVIMDLIGEGTTERRTCFVANSTLSFFAIEQEGDVQSFMPVDGAQELDPLDEEGLDKIRELFPTFILTDAMKLERCKELLMK